MTTLPTWLVVGAPMLTAWLMIIAYGAGHARGYTKGERSSGQDYRQGYRDALVATKDSEQTKEGELEL